MTKKHPIGRIDTQVAENETWIDSKEHAEYFLQLLQDTININKLMGRKPVQAHLDNLAEVKSFLSGEKTSGGIASMPVFGHPEATNISPFIYGNLIPLVAKNTDTVDRFLARTQKAIDKLQKRISLSEAIAKRHVKATPSQIKKAKTYLCSANKDHDDVVRDLLLRETIPELTRLYNLLEA